MPDPFPSSRTHGSTSHSTTTTWNMPRRPSLTEPVRGEVTSTLSVRAHGKTARRHFTYVQKVYKDHSHSRGATSRRCLTSSSMPALQHLFNVNEAKVSEWAA